MIYYELTTTVLLKTSFKLNEVAEKQSLLLKECMLKSNFLKSLHKEKTVKLYGYDYLYPRAENKTYYENRIYVFKLRTPLREIASEFLKAINDSENNLFIVVACQMKEKKYHPKSELYTATPVICTLGHHYWTIEDGISVIEEKIEKNLITKFIALYGKEPDRMSGFINYLEQKTKKPFVLKYKKGSVHGEKFVIGFNTDELSIKMSYLAYCTSILEKSSSLGTGFCI